MWTKPSIWKSKVRLHPTIYFFYFWLDEDMLYSFFWYILCAKGEIRIILPSIWHKVSVILLFLIKGSNNLKCSQQRSKILKRTKLKLAMEIKTGSSNQVKKKRRHIWFLVPFLQCWNNHELYLAKPKWSQVWTKKVDHTSVPQLLQNIFLLFAFL